MEPFYPLHVWVCRTCFLVQLERVRQPRRDLHRVRLLLVVLDSLARARRGLRRDDHRAPGAGAEELRHRAGQQRRLPAAVLREARHPVAGHRARRQRRQGRRRAGASRRWSSSSARAGARRSRPTGGRPIWCSATTCWPRCRTSTRSWPASATLLKPTGTCTFEFPHLLRLVEGNQFDTIYHEHFSYFSLITVERIFARARPDACSTSKSCGPTAARCASTRAPRPTPRARSRDARARAARARGGRRLPDQLETYTRFEEQVRETKRKLLELLIARQARGQAHRRLRRARQGQHAAQLLRHPHGLPRLHRRPQPVQAGQVPARHAHPDLRSREDRRSAAGLRLDPALELQGRDHGAAGAHARLGRASSSCRSPRRRSFRDAGGVAGRAGRRRCASCAWARTATTSRSAAAARCCACWPSARARRCTGWPSRRPPSASARRVPAPASFLAGADRARSSVTDVPRQLLPVPGRRGQGLLRGRPRRDVRPDVILTHHRHDRHQDHRMVAELTWNTFRDHLIARVRDPQVRGRSRRRRTCYVPLHAERVARRKIDLIAAFTSRRRPARSWFRAETFEAVLRLRGIECNAPEGLAEAFHATQAGHLTRTVNTTAARHERAIAHEGTGHRTPRLHRRRDGPCAARGGARGRRASTPATTTSATSTRPPDEVPTLRRRSARRDRRALHGLRRRHSPGGAVERSARRSRTRTSPTTSTCTRRCGWRKAAKEAGVKRFLFSSSCSLYGAGGDGFLDENAAFNPVTAYGESKVRVEQEVSKTGRRQRSRRSTCATPPPTASRAGCAPTSWSTTWSATPSPPARCCCRATARPGARSCTSATSSTPSSCCLTRARRRDPQPGVQRRAARARTSASARSPRSWPRSCRTRR